MSLNPRPASYELRPVQICTWAADVDVSQLNQVFQTAGAVIVRGFVSHETLPQYGAALEANTFLQVPSDGTSILQRKKMRGKGSGQDPANIHKHVDPGLRLMAAFINGVRGTASDLRFVREFNWNSVPEHWHNIPGDDKTATALLLLAGSMDVFSPHSGVMVHHTSRSDDEEHIVAADVAEIVKAGEAEEISLKPGDLLVCTPRAALKNRDACGMHAF